MTTTHRVDLALQGGGAHGAFTWGVLDRLLDEPHVEIAAISGTSAGAMNAVALAAGLVDGGRRGAREALRRFWSRVAEQSGFGSWASDWLGNGFEMLEPAPLPGWPLAGAFDLASRFLGALPGSPLGANPLRQILDATVDFAAVRRCREPLLFVSATHVRSGRVRVFRGAELTPEMALASACLPTLFPAVEIDAEAYWDGGYMGNPSLLPLLTESAALDLLLVQLHPSERRALPNGLPAIVDRIHEITFHGSLVKELRSLAILRKLIRDEGLDGRRLREPLFRKAGALRLHRIEGGESLDAPPATIGTSWQRLQELHRLGHAAADRWLREDGAHLGRRSTVNLIGEYL